MGYVIPKVYMIKKIQLFLLPFAGGNSNSFDKLISCLDEDIEAVSIEYGGRGKRRKEDYFLEYDPFFEDVASSITERRNNDLPYALFGYSLGSALVYDLVRKKVLDRPPNCIILCARDFVANKSKSQEFAFLAEDELLNVIRQLGGVDEKIFQNKRFLNIYLEPLKADYKVWAKYKYFPLLQKFNSDVLVFYCEKDTPKELVEGWKDITSGSTEIYEFGNDHFFINQHYSDMADIINKKLITH